MFINIYTISLKQKLWYCVMYMFINIHMISLKQKLWNCVNVNEHTHLFCYK